MYKKKTIEEFIKEANEIHNNKYDYSLVEYVSNKIAVKIICKECNSIFIQTPNNHLRGQNCIKCSYKKNGLKKRTTLDKFIKISNEIHNNRYDYSLVEYKNNKIEVKIICKEHGLFLQTPNTHLKGCGCPKCFISKGEKRIMIFLKENKIFFEQQKKFEGCKNQRLLSFDFYLPEHNMLIEFDGKQHFSPSDFFGGENHFSIVKKRDEIKNQFALNNNIKLIRIPYTKLFNIEKILTEQVCNV